MYTCNVYIYLYSQLSRCNIISDYTRNTASVVYTRSVLESFDQINFDIYIAIFNNIYYNRHTYYQFVLTELHSVIKFDKLINILIYSGELFRG